MMRRAKLVLLMLLPFVAGIAILEPIYLTLLKHGAQERIVKLRERAEDGIRGRLKAELGLATAEAEAGLKGMPGTAEENAAQIEAVLKRLRGFAAGLPAGDLLLAIGMRGGEPQVLLCSSFPAYELKPLDFDPGATLTYIYLDDKKIPRQASPLGKAATDSPFLKLDNAVASGGEARLFWPKPAGLVLEPPPSSAIPAAAHGAGTQAPDPATAYPVLALGQYTPALGGMVAVATYTDWIDPIVAHEAKKYRSMVIKFLEWLAPAFVFLLLVAAAASGPAVSFICEKPAEKS